MSAPGEWTSGLALLVRRPAEARPKFGGNLPIADLDAPPCPFSAATAPSAPEVAAQAFAARVLFGGGLPIADFDAPPPPPPPAVPDEAAMAADEAEIAERALAARLRAARDEGHAEGLEAGLRQAAADRSAREAAALGAIAAALDGGREEARQAAGEAALEVARLLLAALDAALPAAAARLAPESAAALAAMLEPLLRDGVAVTLSVAGGEAEAAAARIGERPGLAVEEDAALAPGDARASWRGGDAKALLAARRAAVAEIMGALGLQEA